VLRPHYAVCGEIANLTVLPIRYVTPVHFYTWTNHIGEVTSRGKHFRLYMALFI